MFVDPRSYAIDIVIIRDIRDRSDRDYNTSKANNPIT